MANIVFLMLPEKGHLNSSLKIAKSLKSRNHQVSYLQLPAFKEYLVSQGLHFVPLFENIFPKWHRADHRLSTIDNLLLRLEPEAAAGKINTLTFLKHEIHDKLRKIGAQLLVLDINTEITPGLLELAIPSIVLNSTIVSRTIDAGSEVPILILCPEEFDLPHPERANQYYIEASIDFQRREPKFPWKRIREGRRLLYCSLGTQSHMSQGGASHESDQWMRKNLLQTVIRVMAKKTDWHVILSLGDHLRAQDFRSIPSNVVLVNHAPQLEILKMASLMITHGGLNSIKECIFFGVPMIVFPLAVDQFKNAECVTYHRLGVEADLRKVSENLIHSLIDEVGSNWIISSKMKEMKEVFRRAENEERAITIIESRLRAGWPDS